MKNFLTFFFSIIYISLIAQVGVNTNTPNSMLHINGSLAGNHKAISSNYTLTDQDFYVVYSTTNTTNQNNKITLPSIPINTSDRFQGRVYQIKNASIFPIEIEVANTSNESMRIGNSIGVSNFTLTEGSYTEIVQTGNNNNIVWDVMYISNPIVTTTNNVTLKTGQLALPPTISTLPDWTTENTTASNFNNTNKFLDINNQQWKVVSKTTKPFFRYTRSYFGFPYMVGYDLSSMELTYEYTGTALTTTELANVQPIITTGNNLTQHSDVFVASFYNIYNHTNGNTRINIKVTRADKIAFQNPNNQHGDTPSGEISDWEGIFIMNLILAFKK